MPGYGFSGPTTELGVDTAKVATAADDVMGQLGTTDTSRMWAPRWTRRRLPGRALLAPDLSIHFNMLFSPFDGDGAYVLLV